MMRSMCRRLVVALLVVMGVAVSPARVEVHTPTPQNAAAPQRSTVSVDGHPIAVWARVPATPREAVLLVHGRTWSSRPDFDLQVPGLKRSVMQSLADRGIAAYAIDLRGYGETPRDASGFNTPQRAADDVAAVLKWIAGRHPSLKKPALLGWSNGAVVALHVAQTSPALLSSVVLFGFTPSPTYSILPVPAPRVAPKTQNTAEAARSDFITPQVTPPAVIRAFVTAALASDPIYAEWKDEHQWSVLRADKLTSPVLIIHGENDPGADPRAAGDFLAEASAHTRSYVVLPLADHCAQLEDTHEAFISVVVEFMTRPGLVRR